MRPDIILCDIEGTTTSLAFVQEILFPLSRDLMENFIRQHWSTGYIDDEIAAIKRQISNNEPGPGKIADLLRSWIQEDRKDGALKSIQGKIWKDAFESGRIRGHVYPDVPPNFQKWTKAEIKVCIFSSGSIQAQQLLFRFSEAGDLTPYLSGYFDTTTGPKKEPASYESVAKKLAVATMQILFLSDLPAELDAAMTAGMQTAQIVRDGRTEKSPRHLHASTFDSICQMP